MFQKILPGLLLSGALLGTPAQAAPLPGSIRATAALEIAAVARARPSAEASPDPYRLDAGGLVEVRWSNLPESADEVELLLSVDGGRTYSLRLTDELDPKGGSFFWKVPRLETDRACLAIRMGLGGREVMAATSRRFEISPDPSAASIRLRWHSGEIWTRSDDDLGHTQPEPWRGLSGASERMTALPNPFDAVQVSPRMAHDSMGLERNPGTSSTARAGRTRSFEPPRPSPREIPQRI